MTTKIEIGLWEFYIHSDLVPENQVGFKFVIFHKNYLVSC